MSNSSEKNYYQTYLHINKNHEHDIKFYNILGVKEVILSFQKKMNP